ncbi:MAG: MBL fold metallo-hydrolase [Puniceicoccales bacterium]|jgi:phosphoribosyl 1,2-cyclic phosphodiesterase|nr:MBL fold metallo-hydrolase [Puniceicoccales bacterium]
MRTPEANAIIDAGFSGKIITRLLEQRGLSVSDIHATFITHEHNDHCSGLKGLSKSKHIAFFANKKTAEAINVKLDRDVGWTFFENECQFYFRDLEITAFSLPHDAADPVGYVFSLKNCREPAQGKICIMTDLGYVPQGLTQYTSDVDCLVIEANHDLQLLEFDPKRPGYIKDRIRGRYGHLSNEAALSFVSKNYSPRWKKIIFVHLSSDCNKPEIIRKMLQKYNFPDNLTFEVADSPVTESYQCQNSTPMAAPTGA